MAWQWTQGGAALFSLKVFVAGGSALRARIWMGAARPPTLAGVRQDLRMVQDPLPEAGAKDPRREGFTQALGWALAEGT